MKISHEYPPNIIEIRVRFDLPKGTCFTYGDTLYNPDNGPMDKAFMAHEETHMRQQAEIGAEKWWRMYLASDDFRLSQEVEAYQNQYREQKKHIKDRNRLSKYLHLLASDLSGPMYGSILTFNQALSAIKSDKTIMFDIEKIKNTILA